MRSTILQQTVSSSRLLIETSGEQTECFAHVCILFIGSKQFLVSNQSDILFLSGHVQKVQSMNEYLSPTLSVILRTTIHCGKYSR